MTIKEHEDNFIAKCKQDFRSLSFEAEMLLRYGYSQGAQEQGRIAYRQGIAVQRETVLDALGAAASQKRSAP